MVTFVNMYIYSYTSEKAITEPIQRAVLHTDEDVPDRESLNYHIDLLMEKYDIDVYNYCYEHELNEPCTVATFHFDDVPCCVRITPCICKEAAKF